MARVLIVACGCRGQSLARELVTRGHAVRGTTRDPDHLAAIEAAGAEAVLADPDRVATVVPAFAGVTILCLLLASATGTPDQLAALHATRLEMLLTRVIDTTIHGVLYEAKGTLDEQLLGAGASLVHTMCEQSNIPCQLLQADAPTWLTDAIGAIDALLATR